jgi:hypothetical protein
MRLGSDTGLPWRGWQRRALVKYLAAQPRDFLAVATPGSGKATFALRVAAELLGQRTVDQITVVVPTEHLKVQWALVAQRQGLALDPRFSNTSPQTSPEYHGVMVTYPQVAAHPTLHRVRTEQRKTLVVSDEIHHGGDAKTWGEAIREAFGDATRRLALTGTPFRSDDNPIPFVTYTSGADSVLRSEADHTYGYAEALADGAVRPVVFLAYSGQARWRDSAGEEHAARLGEPLSAEQTARAWRTALDPAGEWMPAVIAAADERLRQLRTHVPDAGGMIIASDRPTARAYAALLRRMTSEPPTVVLSDDPGSSARISEFAESTGRWLVAVRLVSEGRRRARGWRWESTPPAPRRRCSSPRPSVASCARAARGKARASSCRRCPACCSSPANWRPSATTCSANRTATVTILSTPIPPSGRRPRKAKWTRASRHWEPTRNWIRSSSTGRRSAPPPRPAATRRRTTSVSPACSMPTR